MQLKREHHSPDGLFHLTLFGSVVLDGQPIRCSSIVPGVSLRISVARLPSDQEGRSDYWLKIWRCVEPVFNDWLARSPRIPGVTIQIDGGEVTVLFAHDDLLELRPGVMQIEVNG